MVWAQEPGASVLREGRGELGACLWTGQLQKSVVHRGHSLEAQFLSWVDGDRGDGRQSWA